MAKSIFDILEDLTTETSVREHGMVRHTIPRENYPKSEVFEDGDALLAWANEKEITHAVLQAGIKSFLISDRARFKAVKKDDTWSREYGQANVDNAKWTVQLRPKAGGADKETVRREAELVTLRATIAGMKAAGLEEQMIITALKSQFDEALVVRALEG